MNLPCACALAVLVASPAFAQENPLTTSQKSTYELMKSNVVKAAEKVPEEHYSFKPTPEVRSFGELVAHIADANQMICSRATGGPAPTERTEKNKTSKADLQKALQASFAACDAAWNSMTDAKGAEMVDFFRGKQTRLGVLAFNTAHDFEHYGNMVTYMRMKNIVPPSSEGR